KHLVPSSDTGKFNLQIDGKTEAPNVGDKGKTGLIDAATSGNPTNHEVGGIAGAGRPLGHEGRSMSCNNGTNGSNAGPLTVKLFTGENVVCTITNERKPQVKVIKELLPSSDTGKFNLQINGKTEAPNVGDKGETGFVDVAVGSNPTVGETEGTRTEERRVGKEIKCRGGAKPHENTGTGPRYEGKLETGQPGTGR